VGTIKEHTIEVENPITAFILFSRGFIPFVILISWSSYKENIP
jgi:hypothetical protein